MCLFNCKKTNIVIKCDSSSNQGLFLDSFFVNYDKTNPYLTSCNWNICFIGGGKFGIDVWVNIFFWYFSLFWKCNVDSWDRS